MIRKFKSAISFLVIFAVLFSCFVFSASAAASTSIRLSATDITVGQQFTVTVTITGAGEMDSALFDLHYNPDVLRFDSGTDANGQAGFVRAMIDAEGASLSSELKFTAIAAGTAGIYTANSDYTLASSNQDGNTVAESSVNIVVSDATKSDNADLFSMRLAAGTLTPAFSKNITEYTATIPYSVTDCKVYTRTSDSKAQVSVEGSSTMKVGENTRTIIVTAQSGAQKRYKVVITRLPEGENTTTETPTETVIDKNVVFNGTSYFLLENLDEVTAISGYSPTISEFKGLNVASLEDENQKYIIYLLKNMDTNQNEMFTFNEEENAFEKLPFLMFNEKLYILEQVDNEKGAPEGTKYASFTIDGHYTSGFAPIDEKMVDYYYLLCYADGESSYYRYHTEEKTLQLEEGLKFTRENKEPEKKVQGGIITRFMSLDMGAKIVVIAILLIIVIIITLIVLVIVQACLSRNRDAMFVDNENQFSENVEGFVFEDEVPAQSETVQNEEINQTQTEQDSEEEKEELQDEENSETEE